MKNYNLAFQTANHFVSNLMKLLIFGLWPPKLPKRFKNANFVEICL
jgi:hypothetical protein